MNILQGHGNAGNHQAIGIHQFLKLCFPADVIHHEVNEPEIIACFVKGAAR